MGGLSLRVAERRGVGYCDVERSRRAVSDARHESVARAHCRWSIVDTAGDEQERENRTAVSKLSTACWRRLLLAVRRSS